MIELALSNIVKYFGATQVLENITFEIQGGEKVGIVGINGSGKSTILKIIAGMEHADSGNVILKKGATVGYLQQIAVYPSGYLVNNVLQMAFDKISIMEDKMKAFEQEMQQLKGKELQYVLDQYSDISRGYELAGGYDKQEKLSKVCIGFKFNEEFLNRDFDTLSGGEKTTVILGKILLESPDLLLLDEPTNHLDVDSVEWLEDYLKLYKGMALIVSHDRYFLDRVVTKVVEVEDMTSDTYIGNYSKYVGEKEERLMIQFDAFEEQEKKIKAMEKAIKDLRDWALRADNNKFFRRAVSMEKRLAKMQKIEKPVLEKQSMKLNIQNSERSGNDAVKVIDLSKSFGNKVIFHHADLLIRYGEKVALIGANGTGKSTLIKILLESDNADTGIATLGANVRVGYLPQQISFGDEELTVLECFRDGITILEGQAREYLAKFLFFGSSVFKKVKGLSGGEKSRLKLSRLIYEDINLLILDEPTNHLDIYSIETLEETLLNYKGTIFFTSHDRYFINKLSSRIIALENKKFTTYEGDYEYYRSKKSEMKQEVIKKEVIKKVRSGKNILEDKSQKISSMRLKLEQSIFELENKQKDLQTHMVKLGSDYESLAKCLEEEILIKNALDELMEKWISIS